MAKPTKKYRLIGKLTHSVPNPEFKIDADDPASSHYNANPGDVVELNDDQYRAFMDRFVPLESAASEVRDKELGKLADAKVTAAKTGQIVNPNV